MSQSHITDHMETHTSVDDITSAIKGFWVTGRKTKSTPSGWVSADAVCCQHNGERLDKRKRGGLRVSGDQVSYSCFNCKFKASWKLGTNLSFKMKQLLSWMGASDTDINKIAFNVLRVNEGVATKSYEFSIPSFKTAKLPDKSIKLVDGSDNMPPGYVAALEYLKSRNIDVTQHAFYWSPEKKFSNRVIIPYYYNMKTVGWTARAIDTAMPKYLAEYPKGYVFNLDNQTYDRQFSVLVEGEFDAIQIDGIGLSGSSVNDQQAYLINQLNRDTIVCPDRDSAGQALVEEAIKRNWMVSFPPWKDGINDVSDAVAEYGKIYTLLEIVKYAEQSPLKIRLYAKKWFK